MDIIAKEKFTKYEIARIIGARALQIAMDAPILVKFSEEDLKKMSYDALKIAEIELKEEALQEPYLTLLLPSLKNGVLKKFQLIRRRETFLRFVLIKG